MISCTKEDAVASEADENSTAIVSENSLVGDPPPDPPYYDLNIIGIPQGGSIPSSLPQGGIAPGTITYQNTIFVPLEGRPKILLGKGDPFSALSDNLATDGSAKFTLPPSDIDKDGTSAYGIYAKLVGTNGGIFTCDGDNSDGGTGFYEVCSAGELTFRVSGSTRYASVSSQLLSIVVPRGRTINLDNGTITSGRYPIFDDRFEGHYWELYDENEGLRIVKLRFIGR
ncbi:hypothetical protein [Flavobacterium enshiense]|uniref:hypothetical protein n=1 Tax=Flavobacterium enshiense TaxID=1341165 RepID=UPI00103A8228|nr:hypothetical protein [Flavobacterium enshiense]